MKTKRNEVIENSNENAPKTKEDLFETCMSYTFYRDFSQIYEGLDERYQKHIDSLSLDELQRIVAHVEGYAYKINSLLYCCGIILEDIVLLHCNRLEEILKDQINSESCK